MLHSILKMITINTSFLFVTGTCTANTVPSVSSINRILRNRAAERAAIEYTKIASRQLLQMYPTPFWNISQPRDEACVLQLPPHPRCMDYEHTDNRSTKSCDDEEIIGTKISRYFSIETYTLCHRKNIF